MMSADKELEEQLLEAGNKLLDPPSSVDELLPLLDRVESCLSRVEQSPSKSMQKALSPSLKALVADKLLSHSDVDVKVAVASCISEITRITAPEAPYDDDQMKEVFQLIVSSFENLLDKSSPSYKKRASIVETVAKVRSCVVMLDLECDTLIVEMFQHFFKAVREQHPEGVLQSIETIMTLVIEESEEISLDLLAPILASVKKDEEVLTAKKMGERVLESCATKLRPCTVQAVKTLGISLDDYSKVLSTICQGTPVSVEQNDEDGSKSAKEPLEESTQVVKEDSGEAPPPQEVNTVEDKSPKSVMSNGTAQTGEDNSLADAKSAKKQDGVDPSGQLKGIHDSGNEECNTSDADKVDKTEKVDENEQKPEQASEKKGRTSNSGKAEPSEGHTVSIEKEDEKLPDSNIPQSKDLSSPKNDHTAEAAGRSENDIETDAHVSSPKAVDDEPEVVASSPTGSLSDENRSKKSVRTKKKGSSVKGGAEPTEEDSKKVSEKTIDTEVAASPPSESIPDENRSKKSGRTKRKGSSVKGGAETTEEDSKKVSEETSDTEVVASLPTECLPVENRSKKSGRTKKKSSSVKGGAEPIEEDSKKVSEETSDTEVVASPTSESLPDENRLKKSGRTKKKGGSVKGGAEPTEEDSKKVPEESSDTEVVASPPSENLPDENHLKKSGRIKKGSSFKGGAEPTKEDSKKVSEETSDTEAKHATRSAKKTPGGRSDRKKTTVVDSAKKGSQAASDSDVKKFAAKKVDESDKSGGGSSARQSEDRNKRKRGKSTSDAIVSKSGQDVDKETLSLTKSGTRSTKDEEQPEETVKSNLRRKRTPGKEIASDTKEHGEKLVGLRVEVYWPKDRVYYKGVIDSFDPVKKKHKVVYDDNDEEVLNLSREKWNRLEDEPSSDTDKEEGSDQPSPDSSPDTPRRKKGKANADDSIQRAKEDSSSKSGGAKSGKSKGAPAKSVVKSKVNSKSKISKTVGKSDDEVAKKPKDKDNTPKSGSSKSVEIATKTAVKPKITDSTNKKSKSKDEDVSISKPSAKAKQETPKTGKSKQETTSTVSASKGKTPKSGVKSNTNGSGKMKSGSLKAKEPEKENSDDSMDEVEEPRVKSASSIKMLVSEGRPGKKRRRG